MARFSYTNDNDAASQDDRLRMRQHYEHGFTDNYALRLIMSQDKRDDDSVEHSSFRIENRFQFFDEKENGFNGAIRLGYRNNASSADEVQIRLNGSTSFADSWQYRQNIIFGHEIADGSKSGLSLETRFAVQKEIGAYDLGIDLFNDFGNLRQLSGYSDQSHTFGPFIKGSVTDDLSYEIGYRHGFSRSAGDNSIRIFIGYDF